MVTELLVILILFVPIEIPVHGVRRQQIILCLVVTELARQPLIPVLVCLTGENPLIPVQVAHVVACVMVIVLLTREIVQ